MDFGHMDSPSNYWDIQFGQEFSSFSSQQRRGDHWMLCCDSIGKPSIKMLGEGERRLRSSVSAFAVDSNMIATWRQTWE